MIGYGHRLTGDEWKILIRWLILVLIFSAVVSVLMKFTYPSQFSTPDDPYFHVRYSALLADGNELPPLPYVSTMSWYGGGTLYYGYHKTLAWALVLGSLVEDRKLGEEDIIMVSKLYHALWSSIFLVAFYYVAVRILRAQGLVIRDAVQGAALATMLLLIVFPDFYVRLQFERPHLIATTITIMVIDAVLARSYLLLVLYGCVLTLCYSFTEISLLVPVVLALASFVIYGRQNARESVVPSLLFGAGLLLGLVLLPNPVHYLFNAHYAHAVALWNSVSSKTIEGMEIMSQGFDRGDILWLLAFCCLMVFFSRITSVRRDMMLHTPFYLTSLASVFLLFMTAYARAIEYFAPTAVLAATAFVAYIYRVHNQVIMHICTYHFTRAQRYVLIATIVAYVGIGSIIATYAVTTNPAQYGLIDLTAIGDVLASRSHVGDRAFVPTFHTFALGYFVAPYLAYNQGMEPTFSYLADKERYWLMHHLLITPDKVCDTERCESSEHTPYHVIKNVFGARFVVYDYYHVNDCIEDGQRLCAQRLQGFIDADSRFEKLIESVSGTRHFVVYEVH